jgi:hypothetical protein
LRTKLRAVEPAGLWHQVQSYLASALFFHEQQLKVSGNKTTTCSQEDAAESVQGTTESVPNDRARRGEEVYNATATNRATHLESKRAAPLVCGDSLSRGDDNVVDNVGELLVESFDELEDHEEKKQDDEHARVRSLSNASVGLFGNAVVVASDLDLIYVPNSSRTISEQIIVSSKAPNEHDNMQGTSQFAVEPYEPLRFSVQKNVHSPAAVEHTTSTDDGLVFHVKKFWRGCDHNAVASPLRAQSSPLLVNLVDVLEDDAVNIRTTPSENSLNDKIAERRVQVATPPEKGRAPVRSSFQTPTTELSFDPHVLRSLSLPCQRYI